jgi:hypothetical protein
MMDAQAANVTTLARAFGVAAGGTSLDFNSQFADDYRSFSFSAVNGSLYRGQTLSLLVSGALDAGTGLWTFASAGQMGAQSVNGSGTASSASYLGPLPHAGQSDWDFDLLGVIFDYHSTTTVKLPPLSTLLFSETTYRETEGGLAAPGGGTTTATGSMTDVVPAAIYQDCLKHPERPACKALVYKWTTTSRVNVPHASLFSEEWWDFAGAEGRFDQTTGTGQFTATVRVPEPGTLGLAGLALAVLLGGRKIGRPGVTGIESKGRT